MESDRSGYDPDLLTIDVAGDSTSNVGGAMNDNDNLSTAAAGGGDRDRDGDGIEEAKEDEYDPMALCRMRNQPAYIIEFMRNNTDLNPDNYGPDDIIPIEVIERAALQLNQIRTSFNNVDFMAMHERIEREIEENGLWEIL